MKERIEVIDYKYKMSSWTFILFFVLSMLAPLSGVDLEFSLLKGSSIIEIWNNATVSFSGAFVGRFFIYLFSSNRILFSLVFSFLMASFVYFCNSFMGTIKNKYYYMFPLLFLLFVNYVFFSQSYFTVSFCVTYLLPSILIFSYFYHFYKEPKIDLSIKEILLFFILHLLLPNISIFAGVLLICCDLFFFFYFYKAFKKFPFFFFIFLFVSMISLSTIIFSQELFLELSSTPFYSFSFIEKIKLKVSDFLSYTFTRNVFLQIGMMIPINCYLYQKVKDKSYTRLVMVLFNFIPIFNIVCQFYLLIPVNIHLIISQYDGIFSCDKWYFFFYWMFYFILFVRSISYFIKDKKPKIFLYFLITSSMLLQFLIFITPVWTDTYSSYFILSIILVTSVLLSKIEVPIFPKILKVFFYCSVFYFVLIFMLMHYYDNTRVSYIESQLKEDKKTIVVKALPIRYIYRYNPIYYDEVESFRKYYNIPDSKNINVKYIGIFEKIEKSVKN